MDGATSSSEEGKEQATEDTKENAAVDTETKPEEKQELTLKEIAERKREEFMAQGYTKRQAQWLSPDPDRPHLLPRLNRKEKGSYGRPDIVAQFLKELKENAIQIPKNKSIYNLDTVLPEMMDPMCFEYDAMVKLKEELPDKSILEIAKMAGLEVTMPEEPLVSDSDPKVEWIFKSVLSPVAFGREHPINSKAQCRVHLSDLQRRHGISDQGLRHIALVCGTRYNEKKGYITITSDSKATREENKERVQQIMNDLIEEGKRFDSASASASR